jgi:hypothetical protein
MPYQKLSEYQVKKLYYLNDKTECIDDASFDSVQKSLSNASDSQAYQKIRFRWTVRREGG